MDTELMSEKNWEIVMKWSDEINYEINKARLDGKSEVSKLLYKQGIYHQAKPLLEKFLAASEIPYKIEDYNAYLFHVHLKLNTP